MEEKLLDTTRIEEPVIPHLQKKKKEKCSVLKCFIIFFLILDIISCFNLIIFFFIFPNIYPELITNISIVSIGFFSISLILLLLIKVIINHYNLKKRLKQGNHIIKKIKI